RLEKLSPTWSAPSREMFAKLKEAAKGDFDPRDLSFDVARLTNLLKTEPGYARSGDELEPVGFVGEPMRKFLRLEPIRTAPDEPALGLTCERQRSSKPLEGVGEGDAVVPSWVSDDAGYRVLTAGGKGLPAFPGGKPGPHCLLTVDLDNDGRGDLVMAGSGGL